MATWQLLVRYQHRQAQTSSSDISIDKLRQATSSNTTSTIYNAAQLAMSKQDIAQVLFGGEFWSHWRSEAVSNYSDRYKGECANEQPKTAH